MSEGTFLKIYFMHTFAQAPEVIQFVMMKILGIETSCDETACAIVENGRKILSNVIESQIPLHRKTGGVVPEVAAREHVVKLPYVLNAALKKAKLRLADIDAVAVTAGPGLLSSLLLGVNCAMAIAAIIKKPLIPVNHIEGHIYANWLGPKIPKFPAAVLTVSGGHNELILIKNHGDYKFLGATLDDAAGEAFDKVSRLLGLGYPGGPAIEKAAFGGNPALYPLPRAWVTPFDFSFSGLKTAVLRLVENNKKSGRNLSRKFVSDVSASFQESVCEVLAVKLINAAKQFKAKEMHLAGGVSANKKLRSLAENLRPKNIKLRFPENLLLCTDNAAMIACAGFFKYKKHPRHYRRWEPVIPDPNLEITNW